MSTSYDLQTHYSDQVVGNEWLNWYFIKSNNLFAYFYRNLTNTPLMSFKSREIKRELIRVESLERQASAKRQLLKKLLNYPPDQVPVCKTSSEKHLELSAARPSRLLRSKQVNSITSNDQPQENGPAIMSVPNDNKVLFSLGVAMRLLIILRLLLACALYFGPFPKQTLISLTRLAGSKSAGAIEFKIPIDLGGGSLAQLAGSKTKINSSECLRNIENYMNEKYATFYVWNVTNFSNQLPHQALILEQTIAIQQYHVEVLAVECMVVSFLLGCGLISYLSSKRGYDVVPLTLIHEPEFISASIKQRLMGFLALIRESYMNHWSTLDIGPANQMVLKRLETLSDSDDGEQSMGVDSIGNSPGTRTGSDVGRQQVVDSINLSYKLFENYKPTVRGQAWRRVLIISQPIYQTTLILSILFFDIIIVWIFLNDTQTEQNLAMKLFLKDREQSEANSISFLYSSSDTGVQCAATFVRQRDFIRQEIGRNYAKSLTTFQPDKFRFDETKVDQQEQLLNLVADSIGPTELPHVSLWVGPLFYLLVVLELLVLYIVIFLITLKDLCFWLFELRLKLSICTKVLRHYQASLMNEPRRHVIQMSDLEVSSHLSQRSNFVDVKNSNIIVKLDGALPNSTTSIGNYLSQKPMFLQQYLPNECEISRQLATISEVEAALSLRPGRRQRDSAKSILSGSISCNIELHHIVLYMLSNLSKKEQISELYAYKLIYLETIDSIGMRKRSKKFLTSTYLDFRLFIDQISTFRKPMAVFIAISVWNALIVLLVGRYIESMDIKVFLLLTGLLLSNWTLLASAFFYSQCCKLQAPIHSMLVSSINGDKTIQHLALLWRRSQTDLTSFRSKLAFGFSSFKITYALILQFNLGLISLYILSLDKTRFRV